MGTTAKKRAAAKVALAKGKASGAITHRGILAIDTDGEGPRHNDKSKKMETSAMWAANGKWVFKFTKDGRRNPAGLRFLNADTDEYAVAPTNLADVNGGPLKVGDRATVVLPNGTTHSAPIGDFGPARQVGEFSLKAIVSMGVQVIYSGKGPIPTLDGNAASPIRVTVKFEPGTA